MIPVLAAGEPDRRSPASLDAKLATPIVRDGVVARPSLVRRLRPTARSTVAVIVAPAGYGKTTLLSELARQDADRPFVWLTVGDADNDPLVFAKCLRLALERSGALDPRAPRTRRKAYDSHAVVVARLVRALRAARPLAIAVEDLHAVTSLRSLKIVETIANNLPDHSQLLVTSRTRPRMGLTALRAEGRLIELGTDDLRLSADEALSLLRKAGTDASEAEAAALSAATEGWPAGLFLAALASQRHGVPLATFDGSDRFVADYFDAEYIDRLNADDFAFLTEASVLDGLSGPLCDAVLTAEGSASRLARLSRSNLFVTRLGPHRPTAYRIHPMLRAALHGRLLAGNRARAEDVALRAADWFESHGDLEQAAECAWKAGDARRFAGLAEEAALRLIHAGDLRAVERWMGRMEAGLLAQYPALAVCGALVHHLRGRPEEADTWAAVAEQAPLDRAAPDGAPTLDPWIAVLEAALCRDGKDEMRRDAARALADLPESSPWRPTALMHLGVGHLLGGEHDAADEILAEANVAATRTACSSIAAASVALRSLLAADEDRWGAAEGLSLLARELVQDSQASWPTSLLVFAAGARSAVHGCDWVRARSDLDLVRDHLTVGTPRWLAVLVCIEVARAWAELSQREQATAALVEAEHLLTGAPDLGILPTLVADVRSRLDRPPGKGSAHEELTPAELRLLPLLTTHLSFNEIGGVLGVSRNTVKTQAIATYRKLGVTSRSSAITQAISLGLIEKPDALEAGKPR